MHITPITTADCDHLAVFQPLGWDAVPSTFRSFLETPCCDPVKGEVHGVLAAVGTIIYHVDTAWLAMIIVHPDHRGRGYGKAITQASLDRIDRTRYRTVYLDATDMGFPVYQSLGFVEEVRYGHYSLASAGRLTG
jgi:GNAT superfamily N-acetyltransferase